MSLRDMPMATIEQQAEFRRAAIKLEKENLELSKRIENIDYEYPVDIFYELIQESPYAFYIFQWVPYHTDARKWRLKMLHDVKHKDGRIEYGVWPNGTHCGSFHDDDVEFIRISKKQFGSKEYIDPRDQIKGQG